MSYPIDIEDHIVLVQKICELTGKSATAEVLETFRLLYTLINRAYDFGLNGGKMDFIGALIEDIAHNLPATKGLREALVAFAAEAVDAIYAGHINQRRSSYNPQRQSNPHLYPDTAYLSAQEKTIGITAVVTGYQHKTTTRSKSCFA